MSKKSIFLIPFILVFGLTYTTYGAPGQIWLDFDQEDDVNTHPGCTSFLMSDSGSTVNDITIDLSGNLDSARRDEPNNPGSEVLYGDNIYRDFIYGLSQSPVNITLWELGVGQDCNITLWSFDNNSEPNRIADWYSNGAYIFTTNFSAGELPWCIENPCPDGPSHAYDAVVTADALGRIRLTSVIDPNSATPFAFINALRVIPKTYTSATTYAHRPLPMDGEEDVSVKTNLKWRNGATAATRDVYLGTSFDDVNTATRANPKGVLIATAQSPNNINPYGSGFLKLDTTYYWRVDEVIGGTPQKGEVWSFKTEPYHVLEDWDSYATSDDLKDIWKDYTTQEEPITSAESYIDMVIVRSGNSMRYFFRNYDFEPYYSEVRANMTDLAMDPNWQGMNAKALSLWFYGDVNNLATEPMYMILKDGNSQSATVTYPDTNDLAVTSWQEWNIALSSFTSDNPSLNLKNVAQIVIRFGEPNGPQGNNGTVYFDDLRLYPTRCVLAERAPDIVMVDYIPSGVIPGDCIVNNEELDIMAGAWLSEDEVIPTKNPNDVNLVLYYPFNADDPCDPNLVYPEPYDPCWVGTMWNDSQSSTMGYTWAKDSAPIVDGNDVPISDGNCIYMSGLGGGRITCGTPGQYELGTTPGHAMTLSLWSKWLGPRYWDGYLLEKGQGFMGKRGDYTVTGMIWTFWISADAGRKGALGLGTRGGPDDLVSPEGTLDPFIGKWVHVAATFPTIYAGDPNTYAKIYVNGREVAEGPWGFASGDDANLPLTIGQTTNEEAWALGPASFWGYMDEVRIYDRALEPNEIAYLADPTPDDGVLQIPIPSAAEIWTGEPEGERVVNFRDFAILANLWLEEDMYP